MGAGVSGPALECRGLRLAYDAATVLADLDLAVERGEVLALLGPSGSGKTTLLHAIAGFVTPAGGEVRLGGRTVSTPRRCTPPERRSVGMVFQNYALWPHLTVVDGVAYPLRRRGVARADARRQAHGLLQRMGLAALAQRRPAELSGGEQQRVGLARALAREPDLYLFDEPTAHLDAHLRAVVLEEIARRREAAGAAAVYATHDAAEALAVADRVAVLQGGGLVQCGSPVGVYECPRDLTVARLTGPGSVLTARVTAVSRDVLSVDVGGVPVIVPATGARAAAGDLAAGALAHLLVRPEWARLGGRIPGRLAAVRFRGGHTDYVVDTAGGSVTISESGPPRLRAGGPAAWSLHRAWVLRGGCRASMLTP